MREVVVSLTSYPTRIRKLYNVLNSIMEQTYKPKAVVLYLSTDQFPDKMMPIDLTIYFEQGLEIHWYQDDLKSHKKYLYAFQEYPDDYIITIDDDFYYERHMIEELIYYIDKFPQCILARRTHLITMQSDGSISSYENWWGECLHYIGVPRMDLFAVGCGGILYPPHLFTQEVFHINYIKKYCMYADDVWLKVMELISGISVVQVPTRCLDKLDEYFAHDGLYQQHNGNGGNDRSLYQLLQKYNHFEGMKEALNERIFSTGIVYENEVTEGRKKDNIRLLKECIASIDGDMDIVIYGAGIVAERLYDILKQRGMENKIRAFVVENTDSNIQDMKGIDVVQYQNADYKNAICIIAISCLNEQDWVYRQLLSIGLEENQVFFLNHWMLSGLRDIAGA